MQRFTMTRGGALDKLTGARRATASAVSVDSEEFSDGVSELAINAGFSSNEELIGAFAYLRGLLAGAVVLVPTRLAFAMDGAGSGIAYSIVDANEHTFTVVTGLGGYVDEISISVDNATQADIAAVVTVDGFRQNGEAFSETFIGAAIFDINEIVTSSFKVKVQCPVGGVAPADIKVILSGVAYPRDTPKTRKAIHNRAMTMHPDGGRVAVAKARTAARKARHGLAGGGWKVG